LLTFFVLLLSISVIERERQKVALNSLIGAFGLKPGAHSIVGKPKGVNITVGDSPMQKEDIQFEKLRNIAMKNGLESDVELSKEGEKIVLTIKNQVLFRDGSSRIDPARSQFLLDLANALKEGGSQIELRGYTAHAESVFDPEPLKAAMTLSAKRARAIYHLFRDEGNIRTSRMVTHGFGIDRGRGVSPKEKTALGRQVEIIVDQNEKIPFHLRKRDRGDSWLDYKGFLFKTPGDDA
jgi:chemotaxis protein MotB